MSIREAINISFLISLRIRKLRKFHQTQLQRYTFNSQFKYNVVSLKRRFDRCWPIEFDPYNPRTYLSNISQQFVKRPIRVSGNETDYALGSRPFCTFCGVFRGIVGLYEAIELRQRWEKFNRRPPWFIMTRAGVIAIV